VERENLKLLELISLRAGSLFVMVFVCFALVHILEHVNFGNQLICEPISDMYRFRGLMQNLDLSVDLSAASAAEE